MVILFNVLKHVWWQPASLTGSLCNTALHPGRDSNPGTSALELDAMTTMPRH
jgi:hypothetical protein